MKNILSKIIIILFVAFTLAKSSMCSEVMSSNNQLDSLRVSIQTFQDSLQNLQIEKNQQMQEFKQINDQIYQHKKASEKRNQPLLQFRLQNALKSSRQIADRIAALNKQSQGVTSQLQKLYHEIIKAIDLEIQKRLNKNKKNTPNQKDIVIIQKLGKEKLNYLNHLQSIKIDEQEWQNLEIEHDDMPQRIRMKTAILTDKLKKLERSIIQEDEKLVEFKKDRKVHEEMLDFYIELSRSVEDEQEIFDRNRLDELKDQLENISMKIRNLENNIMEMKVSVVNLKEKINRFTDALDKANERFKNR